MGHMAGPLLHECASRWHKCLVIYSHKIAAAEDTRANLPHAPQVDWAEMKNSAVLCGAISKTAVRVFNPFALKVVQCEVDFRG